MIPTITGREDHFVRCEAAYAQTCPEPVVYVVVRDEPSWPAACNEATRRILGAQLDVDAVHYTADDLEPQHGWFEAAQVALESGVCPAPEDFDGSLRSPGEAVGETVAFSRIPTLTLEQADAVGPWPEIVYFADCWLGVKLAGMGVESKITAGYRFKHHWAQVGRIDDEARVAEAWDLYTRAIEKV